MLTENKIVINDKEFTLTPINARSIEVSTKDSFIESINGEEKRKINAICLGGSEKLISVGDEIKVKIVDTISAYKVNHIYRVNKTLYQLTEENLNKVYTFLFPCLSGTRNIWGADYVINCFIPKNTLINNSRIQIIYRFVGSPVFNELEQRIIKNKYYIETKEIDKYRTKYTFKIPDENINDVDLFFQGKYSQLSDNLKTKIINFHLLNKKSNLYKILQKSSELRKELETELGVKLHKDSELYSIPMIEYETIKED